MTSITKDEMLLAVIFGLYAAIVNLATNFLWDIQRDHPETLKVAGWLSVILMFTLPVLLIRIVKKIR